VTPGNKGVLHQAVLGKTVVLEERWSLAVGRYELCVLFLAYNDALLGSGDVVP